MIEEMKNDINEVINRIDNAISLVKKCLAISIKYTPLFLALGIGTNVAQLEAKYSSLTNTRRELEEFRDSVNPNNMYSLEKKIPVFYLLAGHDIDCYEKELEKLELLDNSFSLSA